MATKVRSETIKRISTMGMARALKEADTSTDPEFKEAIRRYYPKAQFGPKTAEAAKVAESTQQRAADKADVSFNKEQKPTGSVGMQAAITRRVSPPASSAKKSMRGVNQHKGVLGGSPKDGPRQAFGRGLERIGSLFSSDNSEAAKAERRRKRTAELKKRQAKLRNPENALKS